MAATLRALAATGDARVPVRAALPAWREAGALLRGADLDDYRTGAETPLRLSVAGWTVLGQTPMSQACATLGALGRAGADVLLEPEGAFKAHMLAEAYKRAYGTMLAGFGHAGDVAATVRTLLDPAAQRADREAIGPQAADGPAMARNYGETTQCAAADRAGAVCTLIHSLYRPFGARVLCPETGLIANDRGASFTDGANAPAPGQPPRHTLVNLVAAAPDGAGAYALGTPGAQAQTQTTLQVLAALMAAPGLASGASVTDALAASVLAPRWSFIGGRGLAVEADMKSGVLRDLAERGHVLGLRPARDWLMGSVSLAAHRDGLCHAVADDRRNALALAL